MEVNNFDSFNIYCGPAVLSIFTGARVDDCAEEIAKISGAFKVKGVYPDDLMKAGNAMGLNFTENIAFSGRSIFWSASALSKMGNAMYLVTIPRHYVALEVRDGNVLICDNHTKTELELQNSSRLSQKVERVWKVIKVREYERPVIVDTVYECERTGMDILIEAVYTMSDGVVKRNPLGSFRAMSPGAIREIAFKLMELSDK